jgi:3-oxoacyl-[acyl-carrier-protein] synthase-3
LDFPWEKWFYNLSDIGNIGAGSIFVALEEIMNSGKLKKGEKFFFVFLKAEDLLIPVLC